MKKKYHIYFFLFFIFSCNDSSIYSNYFSFKNESWHSDSSIVFDFNSRDSKNLDIKLIINYSNSYPFQNIYTSYSLLDSSKTIIKTDLIELQLFDKKYGYPLGNGILKNFSIDSLIINSIKVEQNKDYTLMVKQSMREEILLGVNRLALDIQGID